MNSRTRRIQQLAAVGFLSLTTLALGLGCDPIETPIGTLGRVTADENCYSPEQNLEIAYEANAQGCTCGPSDPDICRLDQEGREVALVCNDDHWEAVEDGPCDALQPAPSCEVLESSPIGSSTDIVLRNQLGVPVFVGLPPGCTARTLEFESADGMTFHSERPNCTASCNDPCSSGECGACPDVEMVLLPAGAEHVVSWPGFQYSVVDVPAGCGPFPECTDACVRNDAPVGLHTVRTQAYRCVATESAACACPFGSPLDACETQVVGLDLANPEWTVDAVVDLSNDARVELSFTSE